MDQENEPQPRSSVPTLVHLCQRGATVVQGPIQDLTNSVVISSGYLQCRWYGFVCWDILCFLILVWSFCSYLQFGWPKLSTRQTHLDQMYNGTAFTFWAIISCKSSVYLSVAQRSLIVSEAPRNGYIRQVPLFWGVNSTTVFVPFLEIWRDLCFRKYQLSARERFSPSDDPHPDTWRSRFFVGTPSLRRSFIN